MIALGLIMLCIIIFGYIIISGLLYWRSNPKCSKMIKIYGNVIYNPSIITSTSLGKRGDMGNQLFQIATLIGSSYISDNPKIVLPTKVRDLPISKLFNLSRFEYNDLDIDKTFYEYDNYEEINIPSDGKIYDIRGYRQAYKYFDFCRDEIRNILKPNNEILNKISLKKYIAVHIRRGDYIKTIHNIRLLREFKKCSLQYYKQGIKLLKKIYPNHDVVVCSDSPEWVSDILNDLDPEAKLAPTIDNILPKYCDFCTLYLADGVVMSNSTYSWWASYLRNNRPIIAPSPWWDPDGFIGTAMGLDGPYLHYPEWTILDADNGNVIREPYGTDKPDNNHETLKLYKLIRGLII